MLEAEKVRAEYTSIYEGQLRNIIEGYDVVQGEDKPISFNSTINDRPKKRTNATSRNQGASSAPVVHHVAGLFPAHSPAADFANWKATQTILNGGTNIQHPHCDTAIVNSYSHLDIFPFVGIHGFGVEEFTMWLHPTPLVRQYGFEHTFKRNNLLLMRGDFVHAGAPGLFPRAHLAFYPREAAGWTRKRSFWNLRSPQVNPTFLWQTPTYPFGFPLVTDPNKDGDVEITYPPYLTEILRVPLSKKQCRTEMVPYVRESKRAKQTRREACARVQSQSW
jgi:hypothetical protein